ncbi:hypothetical protein [Streptomyces glaucescens]|uniref:Integral-membrane protein n=1 Tax=Streptomyces glaucescens TaxID=1907 RepID=A0A089Z776_STRGA|nr:hypothetical protein [Streptomyces glaucescens]AIS01631.1 hypothetical protein SGLAU_28475 [Streptomyces glaucescens]
MTAGWGARTVRAAVFAAVCVLLAALGHVLMSGRHVPGWTLAAGFAATGLAGWGLAGRERGLPLITSVVVAAQTALHSAFSFAQSGAPDLGHAAHLAYADHMAHMAHAGHTAGLEQTGPSAAGPAPAGSSSSGMLAAHLLAAVLCGLWLAHGERAAFRILRAVAGWLAAPLRLPLGPAVVAPPPRPRVRRRRSHRTPRGLLLVHAITSRGPPPGTAVA